MPLPQQLVIAAIILAVTYVWLRIKKARDRR